MKVGCKSGAGTYKGFPLGVNLIENPLDITNRTFDLGADFWDDDKFDTLVMITGMPFSTTPMNRYDTSRLSFQVHRVPSLGKILTLMSSPNAIGTKQYSMRIDANNVISEDLTTNYPTSYIHITGVFITKLEKEISFNDGTVVL